MLGLLQSVNFAEPQPIEPQDSEPELCFEPCPKTDFVPLNFDDPKAAYQSKTSADLLRTIAVLSACQFSPLVGTPSADSASDLCLCTLTQHP